MRRILTRLALATAVLLLAGAAWMVHMVGGLRNAWGMLRYDQRRQGELRVGHRAPDVTLLALDGSRVHLRERLGARPLVLIFGSYT
jgi:hypothetical protein